MSEHLNFCNEGLWKAWLSGTDGMFWQNVKKNYITEEQGMQTNIMYKDNIMWM